MTYLAVSKSRAFEMIYESLFEMCSIFEKSINNIILDFYITSTLNKCSFRIKFNMINTCLCLSSCNSSVLLSVHVDQTSTEYDNNVQAGSTKIFNLMIMIPWVGGSFAF